ncbi:MAG TPA: CocE/NonD family hydrolase [Candidatus Binataceae bacterium]|nr:CocE/NonD family hydrolase [Candidatus Binataceae bacterium]
MSDDGVREILIERNLLIPLSDGAELSADLYRPAGAGPFPALLSFYPYHKDDMIGGMLEGPRRYFAERGYAHLLIDFRGLGGSSGIAWDAMDRREGVDGAQAVEWIARQKWCDGNVGMWGLSYGGISSLKVAAENPPHLKAIVPIQGSADIYRDYIAPGGCRSCLGSYGAWGSFMLAMNLMPPTNTDAQGRWYRLWLERLERGTPYVLPWMDHPDYDEYWSAKGVDPAKITTPTFIIGGWRDIFPEGMPALYPHLKGPKKLLMGPWMHGLPDTSPFDAIDFLPMIKRWFDHWLRGEKNGVAEEPPVTINVQNAKVWRHEREWPIARDDADVVPRARWKSPPFGRPRRAGRELSRRSDRWHRRRALGSDGARRRTPARSDRGRSEVARLHQRTDARGCRDHRRTRGGHPCGDHLGRGRQPGRETLRRRSRGRFGTHHHRMA